MCRLKINEKDWRTTATKHLNVYFYRLSRDVGMHREVCLAWLGPHLMPHLLKLKYLCPKGSHLEGSFNDKNNSKVTK
jgi:hypothetical protein